MPELVPHAPDNPDFARVLDLRQLRGAESFDFDIAPQRDGDGGAGAAGRRERASTHAASGAACCPRAADGNSTARSARPWCSPA